MKARFSGNKKIQTLGVSTLEILIAFSLLNLALFAVAVVVFSNQRMASDIEAGTGAQGLAEAQLESARSISRNDFNLLNSTSSVETSGALTYTKSLAVSQLDLFTKQATSTVSWQSGGRTLSSVFSTLFTNPTASLGGGTTCSSIVTGDWKHPQHHEWDLGELGVNGNNGNDFGISNVAVFNRKIYMTMYTTPSTDKDTLFIFQDNGSPSLPPTFLGSVDNDPASSVGPNAIAIASTTSKIYAYIASPSSFSRGQLQVIDVTNPRSPVVVKTFKIPTSAVPAAGTPYTLFYKDGYIYVGLSNVTGSGKEFNIIDVGGGVGTPLNPVWKGGYDAGSAVNDIYVRNSYAYLATVGSENVTVLDVSNPATPVRVGGYSPPNAPESNGIGSNHGETLMVVGSTVYLGRTYGTKEFYILNADNPASLSATGSVDVGTGNLPSIYGLAVRDYLVFLITNSQFQVWDMSNPSSIKPYSADGTASSFLALSALGGSGTALDCENNYFYVAVAAGQGNSKDVLSVISPGP